MIRRPRLTRAMLEAVIDLANLAEAEGTDHFQGAVNQLERELRFNNAMKVAAWCARELHRRDGIRTRKPQ